MFPKCYSSLVAKLVSVQRTEKGVVVCLLLEQNETSPELSTFARPRKRSATRLPPAALQKLQTDLNVGLDDPPPSSRGVQSGSRARAREFDSDRERGTGPRGLERLERLEEAFRTSQRSSPLPDDPIDTFVALVRKNLPRGAGGKIFGAAVGGASRTLASLLRLPASTVSETMAGLQGVTTQVIHFRLGIPQLSVPILGGAIRQALRFDLVTALANRDRASLQEARDIIEATPQIAPVGKQFAKNLDTIAKDFLGRLEDT